VKRIFWLVVGILLGVYLVTWLRKRAQALTPAGMQGSVDKLASAMRHFGDEVRAGMDQREAELREALGLDTPTKVDHGDR
jgi:chromosome condensin MukBEF MukE localization factor